MSHQDFRVPAERLNAEYLRVALQWLFVGVGWSVIGFRADCTWTPHLLSSTVLLWAWSSSHRWVRGGVYPSDWACWSGDHPPLSFADIEGSVGDFDANS